MASVRYFAQHVATGDTRSLNEAISSCTGLYLLLGLIALVVGVGLYAFFTLYGIPTPLHSDARSAFAVMVVFVAVGFVALLPEGSSWRVSASTSRFAGWSFDAVTPRSACGWQGSTGPWYARSFPSACTCWC